MPVQEDEQLPSQDPKIRNASVAGHTFLGPMHEDSYYPDELVERGSAILRRLCVRIEDEDPRDLTALYALTHAATEEFNVLDEDLCEAGSEIETVAREVIAEGFWFVADAYGFADADAEELIAPRDW